MRFTQTKSKKLFSKTIRPIIVGILFLLTLFTLGSQPLAAPTVIWTPETISVETFPGGVQVVTVSFQTTESLSDIDVFIVPALLPFVSASPSRFFQIEPHQSGIVDFTISIPTTIPAGTVIEGSIQLKRGGQTVAKPLQMTLNIVETPPPTPDSWRTRAPMPTARRFLAVAVTHSKLYAIGGFNENVGVLQTLEVYDANTNTWVTKAPMPTSRNFLGAAAINGQIYAVGGFGGDPSTLDVYDPNTDSWSTKAPMPTGREGVAAVAIEGKLYVLGGGTGGPAHATLEVYDPATDSWSTKAPMPTARGALGAVEISGLLYAIGGVASGPIPLATLEVYDPATDTWTTKASMPVATLFPAAAQVNGILYVVGGDLSSLLQAYDPITDSWEIKASMPTGRRALAAAGVSGELYAIGGLTILFNPCCPAISVPTVEAYTPALP